jgi:hypothetical protein
LEDEEVKQILESLVFDGFATRLHTLGEGGKKQTFYRAIKHQPLTSGENNKKAIISLFTNQCIVQHCQNCNPLTNDTPLTFVKSVG